MLLLDTKSLQPLLEIFIFVTDFCHISILNHMAEFDEDKYTVPFPHYLRAGPLARWEPWTWPCEITD